MQPTPVQEVASALHGAFDLVGLGSMFTGKSAPDSASSSSKSGPGNHEVISLPFPSDAYQSLFKKESPQGDFSISVEHIKGKIPSEMQGLTVYLNGPGILTLSGVPLHPLDAHGYARALSLPVLNKECTSGTGITRSQDGSRRSEKGKSCRETSTPSEEYRQHISGRLVKHATAYGNSIAAMINPKLGRPMQRKDPTHLKPCSMEDPAMLKDAFSRGFVKGPGLLQSLDPESSDRFASQRKKPAYSKERNFHSSSSETEVPGEDETTLRRAQPSSSRVLRTSVESHARASSRAMDVKNEIRLSARYVRTQAYQTEIIDGNAKVKFKGRGAHSSNGVSVELRCNDVASHSISVTADGVYAANHGTSSPYLLDKNMDTIGRYPFSKSLELPEGSRLLAHTARDLARNVVTICSYVNTSKTTMIVHEIDESTGDVAGSVTHEFPGLVSFHDFVLTKHFIILVAVDITWNFVGRLLSFKNEAQSSSTHESRVHLIPRYFVNDHSDITVAMPNGMLCSHLAGAYEVLRPTDAAPAKSNRKAARSKLRVPVLLETEFMRDMSGSMHLKACSFAEPPRHQKRSTYELGSSKQKASEPHAYQRPCARFCGEPGLQKTRSHSAKQGPSWPCVSSVVVQMAKAQVMSGETAFGFDSKTGKYDPRRCQVGGTGLMELHFNLNTHALTFRRLDAAAACDDDLHFPDYPVINPRTQGSKNAFIYAAYTQSPAAMIPYQAIAKIDVSSGKVVHVLRAKKDQFLSAPMFVPYKKTNEPLQPGEKEDSGTVSTFLFDTRKDNVQLLMLNAKNLVPCCKITLPITFPYALRGTVTKTPEQ